MLTSGQDSWQKLRKDLVPLKVGDEPAKNIHDVHCRNSANPMNQKVDSPKLVEIGLSQRTKVFAVSRPVQTNQPSQMLSLNSSASVVISRWSQLEISPGGWGKFLTFNQDELLPRKTNECQWENNHQWRCIPYWKLWFSHCHVSFLGVILDSCCPQQPRFKLLYDWYMSCTPHHNSSWKQSNAQCPYEEFQVSLNAGSTYLITLSLQSTSKNVIVAPVQVWCWYRWAHFTYVKTRMHVSTPPHRDHFYTRCKLIHLYFHIHMHVYIYI